MLWTGLGRQQEAYSLSLRNRRPTEEIECNYLIKYLISAVRISSFDR